MAGVSARALGALPVFALATLPATTVLVLGLPLGWAFAVAALLGALAGASGYLFAFFFEFPVGGSQTLVASAILRCRLRRPQAGSCSGAADRLGHRSALARNASHMYWDIPAPKRSMFAVKRGSLTYSSPSPRCIPFAQG